MRVVTECQTNGAETAETKEIRIVVNGDVRQVPQGLTLESLLDWLGVERNRVAVELNRQIVRQPEWPGTAICEGSELEIVQFVGGG